MSFVTRLITAGTAALTGAGILAVVTVGDFEGKRNNAYKDIVGVPTVCYGETRGVKMGDYYTDSECKLMLQRGLVQFEQKMVKCIAPAVLPEIPDKTYVALLSLTWNIGPGAFCNSTLVRKLNARDFSGACYQFDRWNKAGGRAVPGLTKRRVKERALCFAGLNEAPATVPVEEPVIVAEAPPVVIEEVAPPLPAEGDVTAQPTPGPTPAAEPVIAPPVVVEKPAPLLPAWSMLIVFAFFAGAAALIWWRKRS